jgi:ABC-2 type transport system ATP-binding protein
LYFFLLDIYFFSLKYQETHTRLNSIMNNIIEINNLTKYYGSFFWKKKIPALNDLSLSIPEGAVFGFLGPNGAGKTTTIRLLMDLIKPSAGNATILGKPPSDIEMKMQIGFLPDAPAFSSYLSANEFLMICAKLLKLPKDVRKKRIEEVLDVVNMTKHAKSKLGGFSRGMVQRIGIAQAILNNPKLLILDEPLVGLDPHGRQELKDIIMHQKKNGATVFFCSHILSDVENICDHLGVLSNGTLLCSGTIDELLSETGLRMHINRGHDEIAQSAMTLATGSLKLPNGGWELLFPMNDEVEKKINNLKEEHGDHIMITASRESLEDFFFRKIENEQTIM